MTNSSDALRTLWNDLSRMQIINLTHHLEVDMPVWPTHPRFSHTVVEAQTYGDAATHYQLVLGEHTGTHMDAPLHFVQASRGGKSIDEVDPAACMGPALTIDATHVPPRGHLGAEDLRRWEAINGPIAHGDMVLLRFGWDEKWNKIPAGKPFLTDWPGLGEDAALYLRDKGVKLVGCDTLAIDAFADSAFPSHHVLLGAGMLIVENLHQLHRLPPRSLFIGLPLPIRGGSGSPIRAIALIESN